MPSDLNEIKKMLIDINNNPDSYKSEERKLIEKIIKIERKHLHGLEGSSERSRRDEIERLIKDHVANLGGKK